MNDNVKLELDTARTFPLMSAQKVVQLDQELDPTSPHYNIGQLVFLNGDLTFAVIDRAINAVAQNHDALRLHLHKTGASVKQAVDANFRLNIQNQECLGLSDEEMEKRAKAHFNIPFELYDHNLWDVLVVQLEQKRFAVVFKYHHIIADGTGVCMVVEHVISALNQIANGQQPIFSESHSYLSMVEKDQAYLSSQRFVKDKQFWLEQFQVLPAPIFPESGGESAPSDVFSAPMLRERFTQISDYAQQNQCSVVHFMTALMAQYFARVNDQDEVVIGFDIHNRTTASQKRTVGMFSSIIPLKIPVDRDKPFAELMKSVSKLIRNCFRHQKFPISELNRELRLVSTGRKQLFDAMISLENFEFDFEFQPGDYHIQRMCSDAEQIPINLTLRDYHEDEDIVFGYEYNTRVLSAPETKRIHSRFQCAIDVILSNHQISVSSLPLVSQDEEHHLLNTLNATEDHSLTSETWLALFQRKVAECGSREVASCGDQTLSFQALDEQSTELAQRLTQFGIGKDHLVALLDHRDLSLLVQIIAVLKTGAAYVPLDPAHPPKRWLEVLNECNPTLLLLGTDLQFQRSWLNRKWNKNRVFLAVEVGEQSIDSSRVLQNSPSLDDLAYVIYTSGSTGKPKGVAIEHRGMINNMLSKIEPLGLNQNDVIAQTASQCFDISVWQFLIAPIIGARVVIVPDEQAKDPRVLSRILVQESITVWEPVPLVLNATMAVASKLPTLNWVLSTGEALPQKFVAEWFCKFPSIPIVNAYGPAECSDDVAFKIIRDASEEVTLGSPVANAHLHVVDRDQNLLPNGSVGELAISGAVVGRGYYGNDELTEKVFVANPFSKSEYDKRLYLTGDLVKRLDDGELAYVGRRDHQVKIRGNRIELGEIENKINAWPGIKESCVTAIERGSVGTVLVAYYTTSKSSVDPAQLKGQLVSDLPNYMVPNTFVSLTEFPVSHNGKIDRAKLPEPDFNELDQTLYVEPQGELETLIASVWQELLDLDKVSRDANFFELGGHSILMISFIEKMRHQGFVIATRDIFQAKTLQDLALKAVKSEMEVPESPSLGIPVDCEAITPDMIPLVSLSESEIAAIEAEIPGGARNIQDIYPLAPLQEGIHFHHVMNREGDTYITPILIAFDSKLKLDSFVGALRKVIERHDILRTSIVWKSLQKPVQVVCRHAELTVEPFELDPEQEVLAQLKARTHVSLLQMDLERGPLIRLYEGKDPHSDRWFLQFNEHHIISDHVSLENELAEIQHFMSGSTKELPEPISYRQFVEYSMQSDVETRALEFFQQVLGDIDEPTAAYGLLNVYGDGSQTEERKLDVESSVAGRLKRLARSMNLSPAVFFHVAWGLVLSKTCGQDDIVFGTLMSGRLQGTAGADRMLGFTINLLPLRVQLGETSIIEVVTQTNNALIELIDYEQAPLALAQRCTQLPPSMPLFNSMLNYRHTDLIEEVNSWQGFELISAEELTNYPLEMVIDELDDGFRMEAHIDRQVGADRILQYLHEALANVVDALESNESQPARDIGILDHLHQRYLIETVNQTSKPELIAEHWVDVFERQVKQNPDVVLAVAGEHSISYQSLNERANKIACSLITSGVTTGDIVGVLDYRGIDLLCTMVAILKAGAVYMPLDPEHPAQRWLDVIEQASPARIILGKELAVERRWMNRKWQAERVVTLDGLEDAESSAENPNVMRSMTDLAYVIFTSGSTGTPKGVLIEHQGLINNILSKIEPLSLTSEDVIAQTASQCFDISVWQFLTAPIIGGRVEIFTNDISRDPALLLANLESRNVTLWEPVPSMIQAALVAPIDLTSLRWVLPTGEALSKSLVDQWFAHYPHIPLMNAYGPAECSDDVAFEPITKLVNEVLIGEPVSNARLHVLDERRNLVPLGVVGELAIAGPVVGRGYLNQPELTAQSFVSNEVWQHPLDERLYLTGDLVRRLDNGKLEYIGRKDFQIKIRGYRIELSEIEARLRAQLSVTDALVTSWQDDHETPHLVAYLVGADETENPKILNTLKSELPDYMVPKFIVNLPAFPLTANGKIDRKQLPQPQLEAELDESDLPVNETEQKLVALWQFILPVKQIGRLSHFFECGGHSLLAVQLVSRIQQDLNKTVSIRDIFDRPVLADLADILTSAQAFDLTPIEPVDRTQEIPTSFAQERIWFIQQMDASASSAYNVPIALKIEGPLRIDALQVAINEVIARHEVLRTTYRLSDDKPMQVIDPDFRLELNLEFSHGKQSAQQTFIENVMAAEADTPFDLVNGPVLRIRLVNLADQVHLLMLTVHHIATDGWSENVLVQEIFQSYHAYLNNESSKLPELPIQYADYAAWQRSELASKQHSHQLEFWKTYLTDAPALLTLPLDYSRPAVQNYAGDTISFSLDESLTQQIKTLAKEYQTTVHNVLLGAWSLLMMRLSGQEDVVVGVPIANRSRQELESLVGIFLNTIPIRSTVGSVDTVASLLMQIKQSTLDAFAHQDVPFSQIVETVNPERSLSFSPIFQSQFVMVDRPSAHEHSLKGMAIETLAPAFSTSQFDVTLSMEQRADRINGLLEYATLLFDRRTIQNYIECFKTILIGMCQDQTQTVLTLPLLHPTDAQQVLVEFNDTAVENDRTTLLHHLVENQVRVTPTAVAVRYEDERLTYRELDQAANQVANYLLQHGIQPDDIIAVCSERSLILPAVLLGILKAGAAYLPIDVEFPAERIDFVLGDAQPKHIFASSLVQEKLAQQSAPTTLIDSLYAFAEQSGESAQAETVGLVASDAAYVIYTSGSTGRPKGVVNEHAGIVNRIRWMQRQYQLDVHDVVLQKTPYTFDVSVWEFFWPLMAGAVLEMCRPGGHQDPDYLASIIVSKQVTTAHFVPSMLSVFLEQTTGQVKDQLKRIVCSGEELTRELQARTFSCLPETELFNLYGPTEAAIDVTHWTCLANDRSATVPIGKPIDNVQLYVLDKQQQPLPVGVIGELYIGGLGVARGYLKREALTNERFIENPLTTDASKLYRTGDLAFWRHDGALQYVGRNDTQVKVRGLRIELGEIESALTNLPFMQQALVMTHGTGVDQQLIAFCLYREAAEINDAKTKTALSHKIPGYMLPNRIITVNEFPLTSNGKINRRQLLEQIPLDSAESAGESPQTQTEQGIADIWMSLLGVNKIVREDDFFERGGHSLKSTQLVSEIRNRLNVEVPIRTVFEHSKLYELATFVDEQKALVNTVDSPDLDSMSEEELDAYLESLSS